jgi:SET domain-containing protein
VGGRPAARVARIRVTTERAFGDQHHCSRAANGAALEATMSTATGRASIKRKRSKLHGWGVVAVTPITKNTRIIDYAGERISHQESLRRERQYMKRGEIWCFQINRRWVRDAAVGGNLARFINHSCQPNCYVHIMGDTIWIRAARNIKAGEELTYDYCTDGEGSIRCRCRTGCQRLL